MASRNLQDTPSAGPLTEADFRRFDQTTEPGPQQSACPESHWRAVDALIAVGVVAAIAFFTAWS